MSIAKNVLIISPPLFPVEDPVEHHSFIFVCPICNGQGWKWNPEIRHKKIKIDCPCCHGRKNIAAKVTIQWLPIEK